MKPLFASQLLPRGYSYRFMVCVALYALLLQTTSVKAQIGGRKSFEFLHIPHTARLGALGGVNVSLADRDVNFFYANPALMSDTLAGFASANYQAYVGDAGLAAFTYSHKHKTTGVWSAGVQHISYGTLQGYDAAGISTGEFNASETALIIGKSHQVRNFRLGINIKGVFSNLGAYRASALAFDLGGLFIHPRHQLTVGLSLRNMGFVLSEYSATSSSALPFDVQVGATFKPQHMPLRFSIAAFNLTKGDVTYFNPIDGEDKPGALPKLLSHFNFGAEILLHKNVNAMFGYNYLVHRALKLTDGGGGAGLAFGFSVNIRTVEFGFSRSGYAAGNAGYSFTLSTNIHKLIKRRTAI